MRARLPALLVMAVVAAAGLVGVASPASSGAATIRSVPAQYATIQAAIGAAATGDTIQVAPGTYHGAVGFGGKDVTLLGTGGPGVTTIDADQGQGVTIGPLGSISGFTITNARASFGAGLTAIGSGSMIKGNVFAGNTQNTGGEGAAIFGNTASPTIEANVFRGNSCDSQFTSGVITFVNTSSPYITDNVLVDNSCRAVNLIAPAGSKPVVSNNTIARNPGGLTLDLWEPTTDDGFVNNIVVDNTVGVVVTLDPGSRSVFNHNLVYGNDDNYATDTTDLTGTNGNVSADPLFVDAASDFHLRAGSPAIDAGTDDFAPLTDFDQEPRNDDGDGNGIGGQDMGAFEKPTPPLPVISVGSATATEGDQGLTIVAVPVTLSRPYLGAIGASWSTVDGTATSPADFTAFHDILVPFQGGATTVTINVTLRNDLLDEPNETFGIQLSNPINATLGHGGSVKIVDNDTRPQIVTGSATTTEGASGGHDLSFPVALSTPSGRPVSVTFTTSRVTAKPGTDYLTKSGVVTFPPGTKQRTFKVWIKGDLRTEHTKTFTVRFSDVTNASIPAARVHVTGTIIDDD